MGNNLQLDVIKLKIGCYSGEHHFESQVTFKGCLGESLVVSDHLPNSFPASLLSFTSVQERLWRQDAMSNI